MTVQSVTGSHVSGGNAFALTNVTISNTELFFHFYVALHKELIFYIKNNDGADTVNLRILGFHKAHNFDTTTNSLPTDVVTTEILGTTAVAAGAFSAIQQISDTAGYSHIAIGLVRAAASDVDSCNIYGWGRLRGG